MLFGKRSVWAIVTKSEKSGQFTSVYEKPERTAF